MKANIKARAQRDDAVSPVIAVILMVAITVVLAATVYVWVSGLSKQQDKQENASVRVTTSDTSPGANGLDDTIRLLLVRGDNAPYAFTTAAPGWDSTSPAVITVTSPTLEADSDADMGFANLTLLNGETWAIGSTVIVNCLEAGTHLVTVTLRDTVIFDDDVECQEVGTAI